MTTAIQTHRLLTERETAERLGLEPGTLCVWRSTKRYGLSYVKCGRSVRYLESDVDFFIQSRRVQVGEEGP